MKSQINREIIKRIDEFGALPSIALNTMGLLNEPTVTLKDIAKRVKLDIALVAFILKNCNSALYGIKEEVKSIERALVLLGFSRLKSILMSYFVRNLYRLSGKSELKDKLWKHSIAAGAFAQVIAGRMDLAKEEGYLCGLLHDIGKLVLVMYDEHKMSELCSNDFHPSTIIEKENEVFGSAHNLVGMALIENWGFPKYLIDVVFFHHDYTHYKGYKLVQSVVLADLMVHKYINEVDIDLSDYVRDLDFTSKQLDEIAEQAHEVYTEYLSVL